MEHRRRKFTTIEPISPFLIHPILSVTTLADHSFKDYVLDQLSRLDRIFARPMFGGFGIYRGEHFFGIIADGRLYFKTDSQTRPRYEQQGMEPFHTDSKKVLKNYYEVPPGIIDMNDELVEWAQESISVAVRAKQ